MDGILESLHDDARRLVYAAWVRDHGDDERADFLGGLSPGEGRHTKAFRAWSRSHQRHCWPFIRDHRRVEPYYLPADHRDAVANVWRHGSSLYADHAVIRLGFVDALQTTLRRFKRYGREWFARNPIRGVLLTELYSCNDGITADGTPWTDKPEDRGYFQSWSSEQLPGEWVPFLSPRPVYVIPRDHCGRRVLHYCYLTKDEIRRAVSNAAGNYQRSLLGLPPV